MNATGRVVKADRDVTLSVSNVSKSFGGVRANTDVSLDVQRGSIHAIIGPNGAGKTTLLNIVSGFYHPDEGSVTFNGRDITKMKAANRADIGIARTFQNIALFRGLTVLDNLMLGRHVRMKSGIFSSFVYWGMAQKEEIQHRARVEEILSFLKLTGLRKQSAGTLAYGLRKRVELGRALACDPTLLLLDEPMAGMNQEEKEDMVRFVLDVNAEWGTTIVLIEHDMGVVMDICDHVTVLDQGTPISDGTPDHVRADTHVIDAYLGTTH
jgi:branched-chain amino acid transport system ATP-binding protein